MPIDPETRQRVLIVGAGPIGMVAALELARCGVRSVIFDDDDKFAEGSRAIAMHRSILEVFERNGCIDPILAKATVWTIRRTYLGERELFVQHMPAPAEGVLPTYLNLQQAYTEEYLYERIRQQPLIELHWNHRVTGLRQDPDAVTLTIETPQGEIEAGGAYAIACDGAHSTMRKLLELPFPGHSHPDMFLIVDIKADLPFERQPRFFFNHPTNPDSTVLIHPQPEGVWRIDWQVGADVDIEREKQPDRINARVRSFIGDVPFEIVWLSDYRFHQRLLDRFQHGRVFFAGDSAHLVAPFGARGMNSGVLDAENLAWKLGLVINGIADAKILETYDAERWPAQKENQIVTDRTMRFMVPPNHWHRLRRKLVFSLCRVYRQASRWVDSGKMAAPFTYAITPLNLSDELGSGPRLGEKAPDPAVILINGKEKANTRLRRLTGDGFTGLAFVRDAGQAAAILQALQPIRPRLGLTLIAALPAGTLSDAGPDMSGIIWIEDPGEAAAAFSADGEAFYLLRPDRHIAAKLRGCDPKKLSRLIHSLESQYSLIAALS